MYMYMSIKPEINYFLHDISTLYFVLSPGCEFFHDYKCTIVKFVYNIGGKFC